jgi:HemY protein
MRAALWFLALFGVAVAIALFAGNNQGTVTLFWPPYRVDLSLNLVLLLLAGAFVFLHAALRALAALFDLPSQARRWRNQQKERAMHAAMLDALSQLVAGRFLRARKSAESALAQEKALAASGEKPANGAQIRVLAHLLAAESAQALQDRASRDEHLRQALEQAPPPGDHRRAGNPRRRLAARRALGAGRPRPAVRHQLAGRAAPGRVAPHAGAAHQAEGGTPGAPDRRRAGHRAAAGQAPGVFAHGGAKHRARSGGGSAQRRARYSPAATRLELSGADERLMPELAIHAAQRMAALGATRTWRAAGCCRCGSGMPRWATASA